MAILAQVLWHWNGRVWLVKWSHVYAQGCSNVPRSNRPKPSERRSIVGPSGESGAHIVVFGMHLLAT